MSAKSFLLSIDSKKIKYGLSRTLALLQACNNPEKKLVSIQIIGTNGKGSIAAMLSNVLVQNSYKVGLFTSPHLVHINERIRINNQNIPDDFLDFFIKKYKRQIQKINPSFFEIITVISLYYFAQKKVDIAILETGLGGALDSVTAAQADTLIFTPIDYDHMAILGNSLSKITAEKAGAIQNAQQLLISCSQRSIVKKTLNNIAKKKSNQIFYLNKDYKKLPRFSLFNVDHQRHNALFVEYIFQHIKTKYSLRLNNVIQHIQDTQWPGRIQHLAFEPSVIFDVAHNSHSIQGFINYFQKHRQQYKKTFLILGLEQGKSIETNLPALYNLFDTIDCTETNIRNSMSADELFSLYKPDNKKIFIKKNVLKIIKHRIKTADVADAIVILGSHYFAPYINKVYKNCFDIDIKSS
ncbi:MAG: hypothetical protein CMG66_01690 [Candidatus Marinimicrobia bacterium]|nr:hypothetical protein [Candidatus Neomarinimicrobiota bacterium]|tara:strand:+ start:19526 stop:20755 length:1230 start_codon:yes stop_codon:yes gene_type:complete